MTLNSIKILNYKNLREVNLDFSPHVNCFIGNNGEGKTNLLDAIYYLSFTKSATTATDSMNITHDEDFFMLEGFYTNENGDEEHIHCAAKRGQKKHLKRGGKEYKRMSAHIGLIPLILVTPADSQIIDGSGEERRRFMDIVISQQDNAYMADLNAYNKALMQRNAMLRAEEEPDESLIDVLEAQMGMYGERVYEKRQQFINDFCPVFQTIYNEISGGNENVSLKYISHAQRGPLYEVIKRDRNKDRIIGYSLHGIHRDDLEMKLDDYLIRREGSQGQNKTYAIAMKLAQFDILKNTASHTTPILLLDDIFDKLDARRVERIVKLVSSNRFGQIFITDTNRDHLSQILKGNVKDYRLWTIHEGQPQKETFDE